MIEVREYTKELFKLLKDDYPEVVEDIEELHKECSYLCWYDFENAIPLRIVEWLIKERMDPINLTHMNMARFICDSISELREVWMDKGIIKWAEKIDDEFVANCEVSYKETFVIIPHHSSMVVNALFHKAGLTRESYCHLLAEYEGYPLYSYGDLWPQDIDDKVMPFAYIDEILWEPMGVSTRPEGWPIPAEESK